MKYGKTYRITPLNIAPIAVFGDDINAGMFLAISTTESQMVEAAHGRVTVIASLIL